MFAPVPRADAQVRADSLTTADTSARTQPREPNDAIPFSPFAQPTYFWMGWPRGAMYEGNINIPVHLWSRTASLSKVGIDRISAGASDCLPRPVVRTLEALSLGVAKPEATSADSATGCTLTFIPHFVIRQLKGGSAPVRTPSFNPNLEFNWYRLSIEDSASRRRTRARSSAGGDTAGSGAPTGALYVSHFRVGHYSNGQSGCLYVHQAYNKQEDECLPHGGQLDTINTTDGSFSTHYLEFGSTVADLFFDRTGAEQRIQTGSFLVRWYPPGWIAKIGGMDGDLARTYGRWTLLASAGQRWRHESVGPLQYRNVRSIVVDGECRLKRPTGYRRNCRGSVEASLNFPGMYGFGFAGRYVFGWDYYNVGYGKPLHNPRSGLFTLGLMLDHSRAITISDRARAREARQARN